MTPGPSNAPDTDVRLAALAAKLRAEGRIDDAILILEHLLTLKPADGELLRGMARALGAKGLTLEALGHLLAARDALTDAGDLISDIREQSLPAVTRFNAHVAAGEIVEAERYAAALAALVPQGAPMLGAALSCNQVLGRAEEVVRYATTLLAVDPGNVQALAALGGQPAPATEPVAAEPIAATADLHPLLRLRDLHDAASAILCARLTPASEAQLRRLLADARALEVPVEPSSEWDLWQKHYRLLLDAVDLEAIHGPTPQAEPEPMVEFATASGKPLSREAVRALADRLDARAIFFAAADEAYVDLYARWYALSVLKYADVSSMIVVHVIGGLGRLKAIAKAVGIDDERLVFAADGFDRSAISTLCYDAPPKGLIEVPVAHFQSVRFIRLGALLQTLERPVFVSDIDLILQRGVADLLDRCAGDDIVFNENTLNTNAGSRLTANLMLVNPTPAAAAMLRFLRGYLEGRLSRPAVTRWIDQVALIMARHHLAFREPDVRLGYFDTDSDINNVMYRSYQEHPFRFLSLFHGFDTSTLEGDARAAGEGASGKSVSGAAPKKRARR